MPRRLTAQFTAERVEIFRLDCGKKPLLVQNAEKRKRPYIHPLRAPDGEGVMTEDQPGHHPWQHGIYTGMHGVNGEDFWCEGLGMNGKQDPMRRDGTFAPRLVGEPECEGHCARWTVSCEWIAHNGSPVLRESQSWRYALVDDDEAILDLRWTLKGHGKVTFAQCDYGGLFLRMPWRPDRSGEVLNSEGLRGREGGGERARWVGLTMPLPKRRKSPGAIAILDHPDNPMHPVPWRIDGQLGISPSRCILGGWEIPSGETVRMRYRLLLFAKPLPADKVENAWRDFAHVAGTPWQAPTT